VEQSEAFGHVLVVGQARVQIDIFRHGIQMKCAKESTKEAAGCVEAPYCNNGAAEQVPQVVSN